MAVTQQNGFLVRVIFYKVHPHPVTLLQASNMRGLQHDHNEPGGSPRASVYPNFWYDVWLSSLLPSWGVNQLFPY
ncbi:hypothetical protein OUZ56_014997 [Daphnia magna]|uniref:Uncharacterized protein n=1 Tax=Daphnia magna TaxID=35525 RepID=A0ABR0ALG7_9CRUS|nr:hypothetical protein OUZ56_014997 [Daphnia magna]